MLRIFFKSSRRGKIYYISIALLFSIIAGLAQYLSVFRWLDLAIYDTAQNFANVTPAEDILIIDIDERSMAAFGAWPWSRRYHAQLLNQAEKLGIEHLAFDVIFAELNASDVEGDVAFADAIKNHGGVVLPIFIGQQQHQGYPLEIPPAPLFYAANPGVGHVHIDCDVDAICRSVYLREGVGKAYWPHLSLALMQTQRHIEKVSGRRADEITDASPKLIYRDYQNYLAFPDDEHNFKTVSFVDVVNGYYSDASFDRYTAFVGSTAAGNNDLISTPRGKIPGVVVNALAYQQLRDGSLIQELSAVFTAFSTFLIGFITLVFLSRLSPLMFLLATLASLILAYAAMVFALFSLQVWYPIAAFTILVLAYYPLWNWFKLHLALTFLKRQLEKLKTNKRADESIYANRLSGHEAQTDISNLGVEVVTNTLEQLHTVSAALEEQYFIVENTLARLAEAVVLFNQKGELVLANDAAKKQFLIRAETRLHDISSQLRVATEKDFTDLEHYVAAVKGGKSLGGLEFELLDPEHDSRDGDHRTILFCRAANSSLSADKNKKLDLLILNFADISSLKYAERSKLDTLNFLSHDLRSPMVSILALIENIQSGRNHDSAESNLAKIKDYAQSNLAYSESILQLSRAESASYENFDLVDLHSVIDAAYCAVLELAKSKQIHIKVSREDTDAWVLGSAELLERAVQNLLTNALKYSGENSEVSLSLHVEQGSVLILVRDEGTGIDRAELDRIFDRYTQGKSRHKGLGAGLGLYFVNRVVNKHHGTIKVDSQIGKGSCFSLGLPLAEEG